MRYILLSLLLLTSSAIADINKECPQFIAGTPQYTAGSGDQEICHKNYAVIHSCKVKAPLAVFEHLTTSAMSGPAKRRDNFKPDPLVTTNCSATLADYATVGKTHDRGHMAPAANNTQNDDIMSESFYLSNMVAQNAGNNRGAWRLLEVEERELARQPGADYYVISGGIFDPSHPVTGNRLGIPTRLYKILYEKNSKKVRAFLMPNESIRPAGDWRKYETTLDEVETATGIKFNLGN